MSLPTQYCTRRQQIWLWWSTKICTNGSAETEFPCSCSRIYQKDSLSSPLRPPIILNYIPLFDLDQKTKSYTLQAVQEASLEPQAKIFQVSSCRHFGAATTEMKFSDSVDLLKNWMPCRAQKAECWCRGERKPILRCSRTWQQRTGNQTIWKQHSITPPHQGAEPPNADQTLWTFKLAAHNAELYLMSNCGKVLEW